MTLISFGTGNPNLRFYNDNTLAYPYGRLAGLPGSAHSYNSRDWSSGNYCVPRTIGGRGDFGDEGEGLCEIINGDWTSVWHGWGFGISYRPYRVGDDELGTSNNGTPNNNTLGLRIYVAP